MVNLTVGDDNKQQDDVAESDLAVWLWPEVCAGDLQGVVQTQSCVIVKILNGLDQLC